MSIPVLSITTLTCERAHLLPQTLGQTLRQVPDDGRVEVVVVDDASTDGTAAWLADAAKTWPALRVLRNERRLGCAASAQRALDTVRGRVLLNLDDDVRPSEGLWLRHLERLDKDLALIGYTPPVVLSGPAWLRSWTIDRWDRIFQAARERAENLEPTQVLGMNFSAFVERIRRVGGWSLNASGTGGQVDIDLGRRLAADGVRLRFDSDCRAEHLLAVSLKDLCTKYRDDGINMARLAVLDPRSAEAPQYRFYLQLLATESTILAKLRKLTLSRIRLQLVEAALSAFHGLFGRQAWTVALLQNVLWEHRRAGMLSVLGRSAEDKP